MDINALLQSLSDDVFLFLPAEIRREYINILIFANQRMKGCSICSVDHVT